MQCHSPRTAAVAQMVSSLRIDETIKPLIRTQEFGVRIPEYAAEQLLPILREGHAHLERRPAVQCDSVVRPCC